jgi:hypothetical protein
MPLASVVILCFQVERASCAPCSSGQAGSECRTQVFQACAWPLLGLSEDLAELGLRQGETRHGSERLAASRRLLSRADLISRKETWLSPAESRVRRGLRFRRSCPVRREVCSLRTSPRSESPPLSPRRLWFADDGHIERSGRSGDIDPFAVSNCGLVIVGRYIHDPALIARPATIVVALGGRRRDRKTKDQSRSEKVSSHGGSSSGFAVMAPLRLCESLSRRTKIENSRQPMVVCPSGRASLLVSTVSEIPPYLVQERL